MTLVRKATIRNLDPVFQNAGTVLTYGPALHCSLYRDDHNGEVWYRWYSVCGDELVDMEMSSRTEAEAVREMRDAYIVLRLRNGQCTGSRVVIHRKTREAAA